MEKLEEQMTMVKAAEQNIIETPEEQKSRRRSHIVIYVTMFVMSIGFSIVLSGAWPYLEELQPGIEKKKLGWIVAANPLGAMIASPLLGLWGNRMRSIRIPSLATVVFFILGNVMYAFLRLFGEASYWMMLVSRILTGISAGNLTLCRSYLVSSTTLKERTLGIAIIAAAQALGFVIGPGIQTVLTLAITAPIDTGSPNIILDKYTATGWVAAALGVINLIILMPCIFQEHNIAQKEQSLSKKNQSSEKLPKPDIKAVAGIIFGFFVTQFILILFETLATPFIMDQYGLDQDFAVVAVGIALSSGGLLSIFIFVLSGYLAKKFDERKVILIIGFIPLIVGTFLYIPFTGDNIVIQTQCNNMVATNITTHVTNERTDLSELDNIGNSILNDIDNSDYTCSEEYQCACGCPLKEQPWCNETKALPVPQLLIAYIICLIGFPVAQSISQALFSKIVGPRPQGLWMGILTSVGSVSRISGPIFVSFVYVSLGSVWTFAILCTIMVIAASILLILFKRLVPLKIIVEDHVK